MTGLPEIAGVNGLVEIGRGGFGVVYRGTETEFDRDVAVKVLLPSLDERTRKRFERERRAMGAVSDHPNIVTVYRGGVTPSNQPYLVMEYLRGGSLDERLRQRGPLDWRDAAAIGAKLADALAVAHRAGILHRDVKPGNVFQTESGEPKLGDFGIARLDDGQDSRTGSITASVAHAPPEIVDGDRGDERSDLYSLGSTVYALTTGSAPFSRDPDQRLATLLSRITTEIPPGLHLESSANDFEQALAKSLSKRPEDRQATVAEFGNELRRAAIAPTGQIAPSSKAPLQAAPAQGLHTLASGHQNEPASNDLRVSEPAPAASISAGAPPVPAPTRGLSRGQIIGMAMLALVIAGFGGWAVARAALNARDVEATQAPTATSAAEPTPAAASTPIEPTPIEATPVPTQEPTPAPSATPVPAATPTPEPTGILGGGNRNSSLGSIEDFAPVSDFSGAISLQVPAAWALELEDGSDIPFEDQGLGTVRVLAAGGTFQQLSGEPAVRDLSVSGIYVFAARIAEGITSEGVLEVGLALWSDCIQGDVDEIQLIDGIADYQILQCDRPDGDTTGVVVLALVPDDDTDVGVSVFLQFSRLVDLEFLPTIIATLDIDATQIPIGAT